MATFSTYAEALRPDHVMMKMYRAGVEKQHPGVVLADLLRQTGGAYETTTPLTDKFRGYIREVAELTADDELLRIAELSEVSVSLETSARWTRKPASSCFSRLDVSSAETHGGGGSRPAAFSPRCGLTSIVFFAGAAARIEEHALPDGRHWHHIGPAAG